VNTNYSNFSDFLEKKYLEWRAQQETRKAGITQFADYLGVPRASLNNYMLRGTRPKPDDENLERIAGKLGGDAYGVLGYQRPDPILRLLERGLADLPDEGKDELMKQFAEIQKKYRRKGNKPA
jgi:transcriptional regulator with XRE-family HTH domain